MLWLGDYKEDDTVHFLWPTNATTGASVTRTVDGEVRVYKDNNVAQSTAGITDTEDFDGLTGVHACTIDLSADAFYAIGADYSVVLQGATIDGQTVNAVLAHFSIENRFPTVGAIADQVWDEVLTGATHNIATSAGKRLRQIGAYNIHDGTAQATSICCSITLAATASSLDHVYNRNLIVIVDGTGAGQTRTITDYNGTSKVAVIDRNWCTLPDDTSEYFILADDTPLVVDHGVAQDGAETSITLRNSASAIDNTYVGSVIAILASIGEGQSRLITAYDGTTKIATITPAWETNPTSCSIYVVMPYGCSCIGNITDAALAQINTKLENEHGEDSWEGATPDEINDKLSEVHGTQGWDRGGGMGGGFLFDENYLTDMDAKREEYMGDIKNLLGEVGTLRIDMSGQEAKIAASHRRMAESFEKMVHDVSVLENNVNEKYFKTATAHESFMKSVNEKLTLTKAELKHVIQKSKDKQYDNLENDLSNITKMMLKLLPDEDIDELMKEET